MANVFRVVTYNVRFGEKADAIASAVLANANLSRADVIFLQEVEDHPAEQASRAQKIAQRLGMHVQYAPARSAGEAGTHGIATLSKVPMLSQRVISLPKHNLVLRSRERIAQLSEINMFGVKILLCNLHLDTRLNAKDRIGQLEFLLRQISQNKEHSGVVLGGDYNTLFFYFVRKVLPVWYDNQRRKMLAYLAANGYPYYCRIHGSSMRVGPIQMRLDEICTNNLPIINCGIEYAVKLSDHKPLWADIMIPNNLIS